MLSIQQRTLFQGVSPAERVGYTLSSLPLLTHAPRPQQERRRRHSFGEDIEEEDFASDDSYSDSSEESRDDTERQEHSHVRRELQTRRLMVKEAKPQPSKVGLKKGTYVHQHVTFILLYCTYFTACRCGSIHCSLAHLLKEAL